ncbi:uncharacterized protein LOC123562158 [Mercenaria mercenaria]|uniref:uncharacterized protein LOC123562158 n=1 Tax=Mercenaria mercenaria TaxID=6596 RepID=UPI00234E4D0B|nr:uncharacterized protein LOC123562158 [Mercenaria mercenaria]
MNQTLLVVLTSILMITSFCKLSESYQLNKKLTARLKSKTSLIKSFSPANSSDIITSGNKFAVDVKKYSGQRVSSGECELQVEQESEKMFTHAILKHHYNFIHLKLNFVDFNVNETKKVINKNDWIWTYKGENGAHQYLYLPGDFGYLSFGLLWSYTRLEKIPIDIRKTGECRDLKIGVNETDYLIGNALGEMTSKLAAADDNFNSSYWCYNNRVWLHSWFLYYACKNSVCTFQTFEYRCCKYHIDYLNKTRVVQCGKEHYEFGGLWWMLPIIIGETCFAFYPLLLTKIGMKLKVISKTIQKEKRTLTVRTMANFAEINHSYSADTDHYHDKHFYISSKYSSPITFLSTICSPLYGCDLNNPIISRALRIWIIILPMTLSAIRIAVDYVYAKDVVIDAVRKGALVGFSSIIAGPSEARQHFLYIFYGPVTALTIYVVFGCMLIVFPRNLEQFLDAGFQETREHVFLAKMPLKLKERLSGLSVKHKTGYHKIHKEFLAQIFMLLHWDFWRQAVQLFFIRWKKFIFSAMLFRLRSKFAAVLLSVIILPLYFIFSVTELCLTVLYFVFPVINCFFVLIKAFMIHYTEFFKDRGFILKFLCYILFLPMLILFCITWYIYCLLFFDGSWFLSKIAMFTYSGIIAYPRISYGYIVLVFMAIYYVTESFNAFGENYRQLLKLSIEACERFQMRHSDNSDVESCKDKDIRNKYGIKSDLFRIIVDRHLPRRNQVLITVLKFTSIITVLTISVKLLITFNRFQDLSLVSHVFTVLFICALPKIIRMMCMNNYKYKNRRRKLRQKITRTVAEYVRNITRHVTDSNNDEDSVKSRNSVYETFGDCQENEYHMI